MSSEDYGDYYWCVKSDLSASGEIYVYGNEVVVKDDGSVWFLRRGSEPNLVIATGHWSAVFAASVIDGSAVAVEHWKGEIAE